MPVLFCAKLTSTVDTFPIIRVGNSKELNNFSSDSLQFQFFIGSINNFCSTFNREIFEENKNTKREFNFIITALSGVLPNDEINQFEQDK